MSRQTPVKELLAETAIPASPRRSTRIAAVITRRRSSVTEEPVSTPARVTRSKRSSLSQDASDSLDTSKDSIISKTDSKVDMEAIGPAKRTRSRGSLTDADDKNMDSPIIGKVATRRLSGRRSMSKSPTLELTTSSDAPVAIPKRRGRKPSITEKLVPLESIEELESKADSKQLAEADVIEQKSNIKSDDTSLKKPLDNLQTISENEETIEIESDNISNNEEVSKNKSLDKSDSEKTKLSSPFKAALGTKEKVKRNSLSLTVKSTKSPNNSKERLSSGLSVKESLKEKSLTEVEDGEDMEASIHLTFSPEVQVKVSSTTEKLNLSNTSDKENEHNKSKLIQTPNKTPTLHEKNDSIRSQKRNSSIKKSFGEPLESMDDYPPDTDSENELADASIKSNSKSTRNLSASVDNELQNGILRDGQLSPIIAGKRLSPKIQIISDEVIRSSPKDASSTPNKSLSEENFNVVTSSKSSPALDTSASNRTRSFTISLLKTSSTSINEEGNTSLVNKSTNIEKNVASPNKKKRSLSMNVMKNKECSPNEALNTSNKRRSSSINLSTSKTKNSSNVEEQVIDDNESLYSTSNSKSGANSKLQESTDNFLRNVNVSDSVSSNDGFLDDEAIECEEDTPSEDSNYIPEKGESIGSSDSNQESDDSYENDSFLVDSDEDNCKLLSGDEYDLGQKKKKRATKLKGNRLVTLKDSDNEEIELDKNEEELENVESLKQVNGNVASEVSKPTTQKEKGDESDLENMSTQPYCGLSSPSVASFRESLSEVDKIEIKDEDSNEVVVNKEDNLKSLEGLKNQRNSLSRKSNVRPKITVTSLPTSKEIHVPATCTPNNSFHMDDSQLSRHSSLTIQENIKLEDLAEGNVSDRISKVVDAFCSNIKQTGEEHAGNISLNISLEICQPSSTSQVVHNENSNVKLSQSPSKVIQKEVSRRSTEKGKDSQIRSSIIPESNTEVQENANNSQPDIQEKTPKKLKQKRKHKDLHQGKIEEIVIPMKVLKQTENKNFVIEVSSDNSNVSDDRNDLEEIEVPTKVSKKTEKRHVEEEVASDNSLNGSNVSDDESDLEGLEEIEVPTKVLKKTEKRHVEEEEVVASDDSNVSDDESDLEGIEKIEVSTNISKKTEKRHVEEEEVVASDDSLIGSNVSDDESDLEGIEEPTKVSKKNDNKHAEEEELEEVLPTKILKQAKNRKHSQKVDSDSNLSDDLDEIKEAKHGEQTLKYKPVLTKKLDLVINKNLKANYNQPDVPHCVPTRKSVGGKRLEVNYFPSVILNTVENSQPLKRHLPSVSSDSDKPTKNTQLAQGSKKRSKKPKVLPSVALQPSEQESWRCETLDFSYQPSSSIFTPQKKQLNKRDFRSNILKHNLKRTTAEEVMRKKHKNDMQ